MRVERRQQIRRAVFAMVAVDAVVVLVVVLLSRLFTVMLLAALCLPALLIFNFLFLRYKLRVVGQAPTEERAAGHSHRFSVYACSAIFFAGTLYGVLMISQGELPRTALPLLLVPLSLAVYCLRRARRAGVRMKDG
jgi:predicted MFS family arabinose efflux permease